MSNPRNFLSEKDRNDLKISFFKHQEIMRDECLVNGKVLGGGSGLTLSAYLFLTGVCTSSLVIVPIIALGTFAGHQLGKSVSECLYKENNHPTDDELCESADRMTLKL